MNQETITRATTAAAKYGWTTQEVKTDKYEFIALFNRKKRLVATIGVRDDSYKILNTNGDKLLTGRGQLENAVEKVLDGYFYAQKLSTDVDGIRNIDIGTSQG